MNNPLQNIVDNMDKYRIGLDDVFAFRCHSCGKCCKQREDILLNSRDVYNIAKALKLTHEQVIERYCECYIGQDSRVPIVRLKPEGVNRVCPLLAGSRCSVHSLKPTVCALYPIGRVLAAESAPEELGLGSPNEIQYIINPVECASRRKKQTVRQWLEMFGIPVEDTFFTVWHKSLFRLIEDVRLFEKQSGPNNSAMDMIWGAMYQSIYMLYNVKEEFQPQFDSNIEKLLSLFDGLKKATGINKE